MESKDTFSSFLMQQCPLTLAPQNIVCGWDCRLLLCVIGFRKRNLNKCQHPTKNKRPLSQTGKQMPQIGLSSMVTYSLVVQIWESRSAFGWLLTVEVSEEWILQGTAVVHLFWLPSVLLHGSWEKKYQYLVNYLLKGLVMSTIPKRKHKRSDIEANYRNETKTFWCVPKKEVEHFYLVQKLWIFMCSRTFKIEIRTFLCSLEHLNQNQNMLMCSRIF